MFVSPDLSHSRVLISLPIPPLLSKQCPPLSLDCSLAAPSLSSHFQVVSRTNTALLVFVQSAASCAPATSKTPHSTPLHIIAQPANISAQNVIKMLRDQSSNGALNSDDYKAKDQGVARRTL